MINLFTTLDRAKYDVVHDFPGGAEKLGPLVGINPKTLDNKVNPNMDSHGLMIDEAVRIQHATKDYRILCAEAVALNHVCVPIGDFRLFSDTELLNVYSNFHVQVGEAAQQLNLTLEIGVTREEAEIFRKEMFDVFQAGLELCHRLEAIIDE